MGLVHAVPGEVVRLTQLPTTLSQAKTTTLVKTTHFEAMRLCLHAGQEMQAHKTRGPITVQCLEGKIVFLVGEVRNELCPGDWLYLDGNQVHSLQGIEDSLLLLTIIFT